MYILYSHLDAVTIDSIPVASGVINASHPYPNHARYPAPSFHHTSSSLVSNKHIFLSSPSCKTSFITAIIVATEPFISIAHLPYSISFSTTGENCPSSLTGTTSRCPLRHTSHQSHSKFFITIDGLELCSNLSIIHQS